MQKAINFIKTVRTEFFKIVWPSRDTVIKTTVQILIFAAAAALFFFLTDSVLNAIVGWIF